MRTIPVRSSISGAEAHALQQLARGRRVVEAGALLGYSALLLSDVAAHVTSIDRHAGYGPSTWAPYRSNLARFARQPVRTIIGDALVWLPHVEADVAFLDLTGGEGLTTRALAALHPSVRVVGVHDLTRQSCPGVARAIARSAWRLVEAVGTLGILERTEAR